MYINDINEIKGNMTIEIFLKTMLSVQKCVTYKY